MVFVSGVGLQSVENNQVSLWNYHFNSKSEKNSSQEIKNLNQKLKPNACDFLIWIRMFQKWIVQYRSGVHTKISI